MTHRVDGIDMCMNMYDVRLDDTWPACGMNWPVEVKDATKYLGVCSFLQYHANLPYSFSFSALMLKGHSMQPQKPRLGQSVMVALAVNSQTGTPPRPSQSYLVLSSASLSCFLLVIKISYAIMWASKI